MFGTCRETCYDGDTGARFPKCYTLLGVVYTSWCNDKERATEPSKNCHYTLYHTKYWHK